ncbi:MAG: hypothetical protein M3441_08320 [Chloroflexota bacterium]|nr:hypothetical protein [Chloroflexota bacterium]
MSNLNINAPNASSLRDRFIEEQEYIQKYVDFVTHKVSILPRELTNITNTLKDYDLLEHGETLDPKSKDMRAWGQPYTVDELEPVSATIQTVMPRVFQALREAEQALEQAVAPPNLAQVDGRSDLGEAILFLVDGVGRNAQPADVDYYINDLRESFQTARVTQVMDAHAQYLSLEDALAYASQSAKYLLISGKYNELASVKVKLEEVDLSIRMSRPDAEIHVVRQGFITLMTVFDATVFDIVKVAFRRSFFTVLGAFANWSKGEKLPLDELSRYGSFDALSEEILEGQLKGKYLKDLLFILDRLGAPLVDDVAGNTFVQLLEIVLRRNVHVHNRGRVDEKYLERDQNGTPRYNIYNLAPGTVANIDAPYWDLANSMCRNCIVSIAAWADAL